MQNQAAPAMRTGNLEPIAETLDAIATFAPTSHGYPNWASIARDGAASARAGNMEGARASCRGCHDQYKNLYKAEMRARLLPP
jgi:cytochrome c553